jgi:hypothetical protein
MQHLAATHMLGLLYAGNVILIILIQGGFTKQSNSVHEPSTLLSALCTQLQMPDYYNVLGVSRSATDSDLKKA